jgi:hypothetical protein
LPLEGPQRPDVVGRNRVACGVRTTTEPARADKRQSVTHLIHLALGVPVELARF